MISKDKSEQKATADLELEQSKQENEKLRGNALIWELQDFSY